MCICPQISTFWDLCVEVSVYQSENFFGVEVKQFNSKREGQTNWLISS